MLESRRTQFNFPVKMLVEVATQQLSYNGNW